ncbi:MFS transporter [uncultured Tateyamaria sp.]|uniref:MFS transporter n=1 Tax=uncultured Tateyamaria sp. TaxID=455651 RepID=UPI002608BB40|nr:MFS transporter [uncultured Tateyamaria sp.]
MSLLHTLPQPATKAQWIAVWALLIAAFVSLLDVTVVNLAVPSIARDLGATGTQSQWILLAYLVPFAALLLPLGRFGDVLGRRRLFLIGILAFAIGGLVAGTAQNIAMLIIARTCQGIGAATMMPQVLALTQVILPPEQRRRAVGYFGMVSALGAIAGPIVGGLILTVDPFGLGWRMVFLAALTPCVLSAAVVAVYAPRDATETVKRLDVRNGALVALAVTGLVYAAVQGRAFGWPIWIMAIPPLSLLVLAYVARTQLYNVRRDVEPLLPGALLLSRPFLQGAAMILLVFCGIAGVPFLLALALQAGPQLSPGAVAVALVAHPLFAAMGAAVAGRIAPANRWTLPCLGSALTGGGVVLVILAFWTFGDGIRVWSLLLPLSMIGFGMGLSNVSLMSNTLALAPKDFAGAASGVIQTGQQIGITLSIAIVGGLYLGNTQATTAEAAALALWFPAIVFAAATALCGLGARFQRHAVTG